MKNAYRILPVYTGDVSGVCSALYELGGMVVIHDPSGCNSTYNTHDETRWYHQQSLIFISGVKERDIIFGNDQKFIDDIVRTAEKVNPKFIALCNSPLPYLNGTDFKAISKILRKRLDIPVFFVPTTGMHDYSYGAGLALAALADMLPDQKEATIPHTVNLLGVTPLEYDADHAVDDLYDFVEGMGYKVNSSWTMGPDALRCEHATAGAVNLVVSVMGLQAARQMEEKYGIPYVVGAPVGSFAKELANRIQQAEATGTGCLAYEEIRRQTRKDPTKTPAIRIPGEPVTMCSLAAALQMDGAGDVQVLNPLEKGAEALTEADATAVGEEEIEALLKGAETVIADPIYRYVLEDGVQFYELSHEAFSGRCFKRTRKNFMRFKME